MPVEVHERLTPAATQELRDYLAATDRHAVGAAADEHDPDWLAVLRGGLGHHPVVLVQRSSRGGIEGVLPLAWVRSRLFGRFLVSLPYLNRAGVVADHASAARALIDHACRLGERGGAKYVELRHDARSFDHARLTETRSDKARMVLDLPGDDDALWRGLHAKVRNQIRKGDRFDLELEWGGAELARAFHGVFAAVMRDLGTPVYPRRLFTSILEHLGDRAELAVVRHEKRPVAGALLVHDASGKITQVPSAACLRAANATNANMWMYRRMLARAIQRGSTRFDFGRSSEGSGTWRFKKQWGARPVPSPWQYCRLRGDTDAVRPDNPKYQRSIEAWRRLPLWATRLAGPAIVKGIP